MIDLATYPGEFDFRAENLKVEWKNGGGEPITAEKPTERRVALYAQIIESASAKELDSLHESVKKAHFKTEAENFLLLKIGARKVELTVKLPKKETDVPPPWTLNLNGGFGLTSIRDGFEGDVCLLKEAILREIEAFMVAEFARREEGCSPHH